MDFFAGGQPFASLSLNDLLRARDEFHPHLVHKANVVGTAVGRYLIRKSDPYPKRDRGTSAKTGVKEPRTLGNSEVREYSWPCVLVFVSEWLPESAFGGVGQLPASDFVPKTIYMSDGKSVPVCVVWAPHSPAPPTPPLDRLTFPMGQMSGGYPVLTSVQNNDRFASLGCLLTDGHKVYALTNRHVAGEAGAVLETIRSGKRSPIGKTIELHATRRRFEELYSPWPGKYAYVNLDIGLIEVDDLKQWSSSIYGVGPLGPLAPLSVYNLSLNLIGCPLRAHGAASGSMRGRIAALFYRYKTVGGFDYIADFLIGSSTPEPLPTRHGDSGTVWVVDGDDVAHDRMPIAVQWGGTVLGADTTALPFALATNLSTVCRELDLDLYRGPTGNTFPYWGAVGHYTIGSFACRMVKNATLRELMMNNQDRVGFAPEDINDDVENVTVPGFVPLADVPDKVWKKKKSDSAPYGRKGGENPNHYANIDVEDGQGNTLDDLTPDAASLQPASWAAFYKSIGWNSPSKRGLLPFRVWQIYRAMVEYVQSGDIQRFVAAAGVLAHYVGDACQTLHGSYLTDGDPFRHPDGSPSDEDLGLGNGYGGGIHEAYEKDMINAHYGDIIDALLAAPKKHGMALVSGGNEAGFATIELMRRASKRIKPAALVEAYATLVANGDKAIAEESLWKHFGADTNKAMLDGCKTLAMLWDSAWEEGGAPTNVDTAAIPKPRLKQIYNSQKFVPSVPLGQIDPFL